MIGDLLSEFGIAGVAMKSLLDVLKGNVTNSNATIRSSVVQVFGIIYLFIGPGNLILVLHSTCVRLEIAAARCKSRSVNNH